MLDRDGIGSTHHYFSDPHTEDLMMRWLGLALRLYHPLGDEYLPSAVDGISGYKLDYLQSQHIHWSLAEDGDSCSDTNTFRCSYLHSIDGCEFSVLWDPNDDKASTTVWVSPIDWLHYFGHDEVEFKVERKSLKMFFLAGICLEFAILLVHRDFR